MQLTFESAHLSIRGFEAPPLPQFAVVIGRNGVGKTHLLDAMANGSISDRGWSGVIEKYDIASFRPPPSEAAGWGNSVPASMAAQLYFHGEPGREAPLKIAAEVYEETVKAPALAELDWRRSFDVHLGTALQMSKVRVLTSPVRGCSGLPDIDDAIEAYTGEIAKRVMPLLRARNASNSGGKDTRPDVLVSLGMMLASKPAHLVDQGDILRAAHHEGKTIANTLSQAFTRYKVDQYSWAHCEGEIPGRGEVGVLMLEYRRKHTPPWETLREILSQMREEVGDEELFNFDFSDPEDDRLTHATHNSYAFKTGLTNRSTGDSYDLETLSSGESILMCLCLIWFNQELGRRRPEMLLLDELDALLHPSMVSALVACLKRLFVANGTHVLMATHSASTVAVLNDGEIFRLTRRGGHLKLGPVSRSEAVDELSQGIATLDTGLRIATSEVAPVTVVSEGKNCLHLRRWAELHFPGQVDVFDKLPAHTGAAQLRSYALILSMMNTNSHLLFVWDSVVQ